MGGNYMKRNVQKAISLLLLMGTLATNFMTVQATNIQAANIEPRYIGIAQLRSSLNISSGGAASCTGKVILWDDYTADLTIELKQDGTIIKTWTKSGSGVVSGGGTYYVASGHDYVVTTTVAVYDKDGRVVETPSKDSPESHY